MEKIKAKDIQAKQKYIMGWHGDGGGFRKYKLDVFIEGNKFFKDVIYKEVCTPRGKGPYGKWGKGKSIYYFEDGKNSFKSPIELLKTKYEIQ